MVKYKLTPWICLHTNLCVMLKLPDEAALFFISCFSASQKTQRMKGLKDCCTQSASVESPDVHDLYYEDFCVKPQHE